jgi:RNA polymerase sigma-70 factor (ECF subfamily)
MADRSEKELFDAVLAGDEQAFERVYDRYHQRARVIAWRVSHRPDWVDDILNEAWCRAFRLRRTYNPDQPFAAWFAGIVRNVYREQCRKSVATFDASLDDPAGRTAEIDDLDPERIAAQAELLAGLNDCIGRLEPLDARIVRLRFFEEMTLRTVAKEVQISESTLREIRLPAAFRALRRCLDKKGIRFSDIFPAQAGDEMQ